MAVEYLSVGGASVLPHKYQTDTCQVILNLTSHEYTSIACYVTVPGSQYNNNNIIGKLENILSTAAFKNYRFWVSHSAGQLLDMLSNGFVKK